MASDDFVKSIVGWFRSNAGGEGQPQSPLTACPLRGDFQRLGEFEASSADIIKRHMLGHLLDYQAGTVRTLRDGTIVRMISQQGIEGQLRYIYNDLTNPKLHAARERDSAVAPSDDPDFQGFGPEQHGCSGPAIEAELMAEAFRAYMQDPDYIKTVAPQVARRIRDSVNPNPELKRIISFN